MSCSIATEILQYRCGLFMEWIWNFFLKCVKINFAWQLEKGHYCSPIQRLQKISDRLQKQTPKITGGTCLLTEKVFGRILIKRVWNDNEQNLERAAWLCYRQRVTELRFLLKLYIQLCVYWPWCAKTNFSLVCLNLFQHYTSPP